jgi:hypothetical protein
MGWDGDCTMREIDHEVERETRPPIISFYIAGNF